MDGQDQTKRRLLEAAGEEFAEKGFDAARIRAICDRAGANVAAVNYHFGDKEQLYIESVLDAHRCEAATDDETSRSHETPEEELRDFIRHFLCHVLAVHDPDDWRHRLMLRELLNPTSASDVLIREAIRPKFERLGRILGRFCPEADERKRAVLAFSVIGQCLHYKMARPVAERLVGPGAFRALDLDYLTDHIASFCLAALGSLPPLNAAGEAARDQTVVVD